MLVLFPQTGPLFAALLYRFGSVLLLLGAAALLRVVCVSVTSLLFVRLMLVALGLQLC